MRGSADQLHTSGINNQSSERRFLQQSHHLEDSLPSLTVQGNSSLSFGNPCQLIISPVFDKFRGSLPAAAHTSTLAQSRRLSKKFASNSAPNIRNLHCNVSASQCEHSTEQIQELLETSRADPEGGGGETFAGAVEPERIPVLHSHFHDFFFKLRLRSWARRALNATRARMYSNLTFKQLEIINDKAVNNHSQQRNRRQHFNDLELSANFSSTSSTSPDSNFSCGLRKKIEGYESLVRRFINLLPVLDPDNSLKTSFNFLAVIATIFIFLSFSISLSFHVPISFIAPLYVVYVTYVLLLLNVIVILNSGFLRLGTAVTDRHDIFIAYISRHFSRDVAGLFSILLIILLDNNESYQTQNDILASFKLLCFLPFLLKLQDVSTYIETYEDRVMSKQKTKHILQLVRLFSTIVLVSHLMACVWIFNSKMSNNADSNWLSAINADREPWGHQYILAYYFASVTMTTVGYGDITAKNLSEFAIAIFIMMISSGMFGFTLNRIGNIFSEFYAQEQELKVKLDIINLHMENKNVSHALRAQIREYLEYIWKEDNQKLQDQTQEIVSQLNEDLKRELYLHQNKQFIVYLKNYFSEALIQKAILLVKEQKVKPHQVINLQGSGGSAGEDICLYLVAKGQCEVYLDSFNPESNLSTSRQLHVIEEGQIFGMTEFFNGKNRRLNVKAIGFVNLLTLSRSQFIEILQDFRADLEMFIYLKDRQLFNKEYKKLGAHCYSCNSSDHSIENCSYVHLTQDSQKHISKLNYGSYQIEADRRKAWQFGQLSDPLTTRSSQRKGKVIIDSDDPDFEEFMFLQYEHILEYEQKHLSFDFNHDLIFGRLHFSDDEEEQHFNIDQSTIEQQMHHQQLHHNSPDRNFFHELSVSPNTRMNQRSYSRLLSNPQKFQLNTPLIPITAPTNTNAILNNILEAIPEDQTTQNSEIFLANFMRTNSIKSEQLGSAMNNIDSRSPTQSLNQPPSIIALKSLLGASQSLLGTTDGASLNEQRRSSFMRNLNPLITTGNGFMTTSANTDFRHSQRTNNFPVHTIAKRGINNQNIYQASSPHNTQSQQGGGVYHRRPQKDISLSGGGGGGGGGVGGGGAGAGAGAGGIGVVGGVGGGVGGGGGVQTSIIHMLDGAQSQLNHQHSSRDNFTSMNSYQCNSSLQKFQQQLLINIKSLLAQGVRKNSKNATITKTMITDEQQELTGMTEIFRNFDKQKHFTIYYPLNNLNFVLFNRQNKKFLSQEQYLQLLQTTGRSSNLLKQKAELFKNKTEKAINKRGGTMKNIPGLAGELQLSHISPQVQISTLIFKNNHRNPTTPVSPNMPTFQKYDEVIVTNHDAQIALQVSQTLSMKSQIEGQNENTSVSESEPDVMGTITNQQNRTTTMQSHNLIEREESMHNLNTIVKHLEVGQNSDYFVQK